MTKRVDSSVDFIAVIRRKREKESDNEIFILKIYRIGLKMWQKDCSFTFKTINLKFAGIKATPPPLNVKMDMLGPTLTLLP